MRYFSRHPCCHPVHGRLLKGFLPVRPPITAQERTYWESLLFAKIPATAQLHVNAIAVLKKNWEKLHEIVSSAKLIQIQSKKNYHVRNETK